MPQDGTAKNVVAFTQFGGLSSNADKRDIQTGAAILTNMTLNVPGQLSSRLGHEEVEFANAQAAVNHEILAMTRYETASYTYIVYETDDGSIRTGRTPE
jgi:hypothetical protein